MAGVAHGTEIRGRCGGQAAIAACRHAVVPVAQPMRGRGCGGVAGVSPAEGGGGRPAQRGCRQGGDFPPQRIRKARFTAYRSSGVRVVYELERIFKWSRYLIVLNGFLI
jgi:hypothetical protein